MQRSCLGTLRAMALVALVLGAQNLAQAGDFAYLDGAFRNATKAADTEQKARGLAGFGPASSTTCVIGAMIDRGGDSSLVWNFGLLPGKSYLFVAAGDSDVTGLELACTNKGEEKPFDTQGGAAPVSLVKIPPDQDRATVRVSVKVTAAKEASDFVVIVCLESPGTSGNLSAVEGCITSLAGEIEKSPDKEGLSLDGEHDDICLYCRLLTSDAPERSFSRMFRKGTHYRLYSTGDMNCRNIGASVFKRGDDGADAEQVGKGAAPAGPSSLVDFDAGTDDDWRGNVRIKIGEFDDPTKPSFAVTAFVVTK